MKKLLVAGIAAAAFCGAPSLAADMPTKAPVYKAAPPFDWTGWYAGANVGYGFGSDRINFDPLDAGAVTRAAFVTPQLADDPKGFLGGLQLGANKQVGNIVYGVETDISFSQIRDNVSGPIQIDWLTSGVQKLDWFGTLRARAGLVTLDRSLIYVTGGPAYGRATLSTNTLQVLNSFPGGCLSGGDFCMTGSSEKWMVGWTIGGGWEYAFASNWSAKLEYLYYDLGKITDINPQINGTSGITFQGSTEVKGNIVRVGLNYKFGM
jgi:outer membrane immunogenic protein